ncbi:hypothetical protein PCANC_12194 [Puccinia coronata f. sp. avenae]|uniref:Uncharacterized protein n=1 Tax=Puccinia coronata f. sp. avenae TaxID=200324 RepID=A0A2N5VF04_9BASI|nr:hypothetical protein PCANC_12194 [Puccinia coronata f. sp. avenae]
MSVLRPQHPPLVQPTRINVLEYLRTRLSFKQTKDHLLPIIGTIEIREAGEWSKKEYYPLHRHLSQHNNYLHAGLALQQSGYQFKPPTRLCLTRSCCVKPIQDWLFSEAENISGPKSFSTPSNRHSYTR